MYIQGLYQCWISTKIYTQWKDIVVKQTVLQKGNIHIYYDVVLKILFLENLIPVWSHRLPNVIYLCGLQHSLLMGF